LAERLRLKSRAPGFRALRHQDGIDPLAPREKAAAWSMNGGNPRTPPEAVSQLAAKFLTWLGPNGRSAFGKWWIAAKRPLVGRKRPCDRSGERRL